MVKEYKIKKVKELRENIRKSKDLIFVNYQGVKVEEIQSLKKQLRQYNVYYKVVQNNLFRIALKEEGFTQIDENVFSGTLGVCFLPEKSDVSQILKVMFGFIKSSGKISLKTSFIDKRNFNLKELESISQLPPRDVLVAKVIGTIKAPLSRLHSVLNGQLQKLVVVLNSIQEQKSKS